MEEVINMVTSKDLHDLIEGTLQNFKARLMKNIQDKKSFWSDDEYGEGLQNRVEGLEAFFIPFYSKDFNGVSKYISADDLKKEIENIYNIVKSDGFKPTPYIESDLEEILKKHIKKHDFIDSVSYTLTTIVAGMLCLNNAGKLDGNTNEMSIYLLKKCIKWLTESHNPNGGWTGFSEVINISNIYATWSALSVIPEVNVILAEKFRIDDDLKNLSKQLIKISFDCKKWLLEFGKVQGKYWDCDTQDGAARGVIYTVYGLDTLYLLEAHNEKAGFDLMIDTLERIVTVWDDYKEKFMTQEVHALPAELDKKGNPILIKYEDSSILTVSIKAVSRFAYILKSKQLNNDILVKSERLLSEMYEDLIQKRLKDNLWTDTGGRFSIYVTERVIEALVAYEKFLTPIVQKQDLITDKIDSILSKIDLIENLVKSIDARIAKIESIVIIEDLDPDTKEQLDQVNNVINTLPNKKK